MYDVIEVKLGTNRVSVMATNKTEANAEAVVNMAVMRRGLDGQFYTTVPSGTYKDGDRYQP